ncbi:hypothetical protein HU200_066143 [Digitaria exilis]|uniref:Uncharacterized protein n=1 Tax=Digitaria exilis TaxID=1010633 RepID=A0A835DT49_9POAL|nr:hypothetical protein HU200_066143 [Digitaria exilis]
MLGWPAGRPLWPDAPPLLASIQDSPLRSAAVWTIRWALRSVAGPFQGRAARMASRPARHLPGFCWFFSNWGDWRATRARSLASPSHGRGRGRGRGRGVASLNLSLSLRDTPPPPSSAATLLPHRRRCAHITGERRCLRHHCLFEILLGIPGQSGFWRASRHK